MNCRIAVFVGAFALAAALSSSIAKADTLTGTTVSGSMTANTPFQVTTQFASSVMVGSGADFSGDISFNNGIPTDYVSDLFTITADFYDGGLTVEENGPYATATGFAEAGSTMFSLTFSDSAFVTPFTLADVTCAPGTFCASAEEAGDSFLTGDTLSGDTLTLDFRLASQGQIYTFTDGPAAAATPEPSAIALLGTGLLGLGGVVRRRMA